jgi:rhodanese-related sulfurtransferase
VVEYLEREEAPIVPPGRVKALIEDEGYPGDTQIVSVREPDIFEVGHVPGAINVPWRTIVDEEGLSRLSDGPMVVYCYTGHTGQVAATILGLLGYDVKNMKYGMMGWTDDQDVLGVEPFDCEATPYEVEVRARSIPADQVRPIFATGESAAEAIVRARAAEILRDWAPIISPADVRALIDDPAQAESYVLVSVRSPEDYLAGHIPGAINIPWKTLAEECNLGMLPPDKRIITYCYTGHTGQIAATLLKLLGYDAVNMKYGMMGWNEAFMGDVTPFECDDPRYEIVAGPDPR